MIALPLAVVAAVAGAPVSHLQLSLDAAGATESPRTGYTPSTLQTAPTYGYGDVTAGLSIYFRGVRDDDAPLSLQPFLQRASLLHLSAGAGATSNTRYFTDGLDYFASRVHVTASASVDAYVHRNVILDVGLAFAGWQDQYHGGTISGQAPPPSGPFAALLTPHASIGLRVYDVRVDLGYRIDLPASGDLGGLEPWGVYADVFAVVRRRVTLSASVGGQRGGAYGNAGASVFLGRRFDVFLSVGGGQFEDLGTAELGTNVGGSLGVTVWQSRYFGGSFALEPTYVNYMTHDRVQMMFALSFFSRPK